MQSAPPFSIEPQAEGEARQTDSSVRERRRRFARTLVRAGGGASAFLLVATLFVGFLHTKAGHPLLMKLAGLVGCPMGRASAAQVEAARRAAVARDRGNDPAPVRPALGFSLDKTTLAEIRVWEGLVGADCTEERDGTLVKCDNVSSTAIGRPESEGTIAELSFSFPPNGPLVSVTTLYSHRSAIDTKRIAANIEATLGRELGPAHKVAGSFAQLGSTATLEYRFRDYAVDLTSSQVPGSGYAVREQYISAL